MKKLNLLLLGAIYIALTGCNKDLEYAEFNLNVSAFNVQTSLFKGDDPFASFVHKYSRNMSITFIGSDIRFEFLTGDKTIETFKFSVPVGTYKISGKSYTNAEVSAYMSFDITEQTISISESTTSMPISITPTCCLLIVADPEKTLAVGNSNTNYYVYHNGIYYPAAEWIIWLANDGGVHTDVNDRWKRPDGTWSSTPTIPNLDPRIVSTNGTFVLTKLDSIICYGYVIPNDNSSFFIDKKDNTQLLVKPTNSTFKPGYKYKFLVNSATTPSIINPNFKETYALGW